MNKASLFQYATMIALMLCNMAAHGQFQNGSNMSFGQNRIQYAQREWSYYRTDYADIYYYPQSKDLAVYTAEHIPEILLEMEQKSGVSNKKKMQIILYANFSKNLMALEIVSEPTLFVITNESNQNNRRKPRFITDGKINRIFYRKDFRTVKICRQ